MTNVHVLIESRKALLYKIFTLQNSRSDWQSSVTMAVVSLHLIVKRVQHILLNIYHGWLDFVYFLSLHNIDDDIINFIYVF